MALVKLKDIQSRYHDHDNNNDKIEFDHFSVYAIDDDANATASDDKDKVGSVKDVLIDEQEGLFRYLIVETGTLGLGKKVLLPIGLARFEYDQKRVYVDRLTKDQVKHLPEFSDDLKIDNDYEERVRGVYRPIANQSDRTVNTTNLGGVTPGVSTAHGSYSYDQDPYLYNRNVEESDRVSAYERQLARINRTPQ